MLRTRAQSGHLIQRRHERFEFDVNRRRARAIGRLVHRTDVVLELLVGIGRRARDHERGETSVTLFMLEQPKADARGEDHAYDDESFPCHRFTIGPER